MFHVLSARVVLLRDEYFYIALFLHCARLDVQGDCMFVFVLLFLFVPVLFFLNFFFIFFDCCLFTFSSLFFILGFD